MRRAAKLVVLAVTVVLSMWLPDGRALASDEGVPAESDRAAIDLAICLDTSGSMKPLLDAASMRLWDIVSDLALADPTPRLRVALVTYGNPTYDAEAGWVRVETDFTEDLDLVSDRLFALTSEGGREFVGRVLHVAVEELSWSSSSDAVKLIFVAGNETADQDPQVSVEDEIETAIARNIVINTVFCGRPDNSDADTWKEIARLAETEFASIDHRADPVVVETPFDDELTSLSAAINETYVPLGDQGRMRQENQVLQDENAEKLGPGAAAGRAQIKASVLYTASWDLVDALATESVSLDEIDEAELPDYLQEMSFDEREAYVADMRAKRAEIRERIAELSADRRRYVAQQIEAKGIDDSRTFDGAVRRAIRDKLEKRGVVLD